MTESATVCFFHDDAVEAFRGRIGPRFGGAETQILLMVRMLAMDRRFSVLFSTVHDTSDIQVEGVRFIRRKPTISRGVPVVSGVLNRRRMATGLAGIDRPILLQMIAGAATADVARAATRVGGKFVFCVSSDVDVDGSILPEWFRPTFFETLKRADGIIAQSEHQQARLRELHGVDSVIIPNPIEVPKAFTRRAGEYVLWVGRAAPVKRPSIMIETARSLPQHEFIMIMRPEDETFWAGVMSEAEQVPNLTVIPGVDDLGMQGYFENASLLASTSAFEGFPYVFLEAGAAGKPIVSLEVDPRGILDERGCGYCAHGDRDAFRTAIDRLAADPESAAAAGERAYEYVKAHHGVEAIARLLSDYLLDIRSSS